ncbi:MAG TPA: efflux RND transporter permease subunit, partial [Candidatus Hypogeohydataceae bacterium YC40]
EEWRKGMTREKILMELDSTVKIPGWSNIWTQPIINRVDMTSTGIRTQVGAKIYGSDQRTVVNLAEQVANVLRTVRGAVDIYPDKLIGENYLEIDPDRKQVARYGINIGDVQDVIEVAMGGKTITTTVEGRRRFPVRVRYARELRATLDKIQRILVPTAMGAQIPLYQLADIRIVPGPSMIRGENGLLVAYVLFNVRGRDVIGVVEEAQKVTPQRIKLPPGYFIQWSGQYEHQMRAKKTLQFLVPIVIVIMFIVLYITYTSFIDATIIMITVPTALTGGLIFQYFWGFNFSVAVWVGYIALFGMATSTGILMVAFLVESFEKRGVENIKEETQVTEAILDGAVLRLRPKLLTISTTIFGLLPMLWATGSGSEIMRPLAVPIIGGSVTSTLVTLFVIPVVYHMVKKWQLLRPLKPKKVKVKKPKRGWFWKKRPREEASSITYTNSSEAGEKK